MMWMGFEPMIPVFERAKAFHVLNSTATVVGDLGSYWSNAAGYFANGD
jgi:hypothetical protein